MARNTTGTPNTSDYTLGRGIVYLAKIGANDLPDDNGWRDVGNAPAFTVSSESEKLPHYSSRTGLQVKDKEITTSQDMEIGFTLDERNDQNLSLFLAGDTADHVNAAIAGFTNVVLSSSVLLGRWYDLLDGNGERAYGVTSANLTLEEGGTPTALVEGTDFDLDADMGRVFIRTTATNISNGQTLRATVAANAGAGSVQEVRGLTQGNQVFAVKFIAENPANENSRTEYVFHKVTLSADGELPLIGEEWQEMGFSGSVEAAPLADVNAPYCRVRELVN